MSCPHCGQEPGQYVSHWLTFLQVRARLIDEFIRTDGKSPAEVARILSMDPEQVLLIQMSNQERRP